jgi:hypothetical protein
MIPKEHLLSENHVIIELIQIILEMNEDERLKLLLQLKEMGWGKIAAENNEREDTRKEYTNIIEFTSRNHAYKGTSRDISSSGMFIETKDSFSVGQIIHLSIPFPDNMEYVKTQAEIVRVTPDGIGIKFIKSS